MSRITRSFRLLKQSWAVLMMDKELLVLPFLSGLVILVVAASFIVPIAIVTGGDLEEGNAAWYLVLLAFYIVTYTVGIYFQAAIIAGANERMEGGDPTVGSALKAASSHFGTIVMWGVVAGTVGMILKTIQERSDLVGKIVIAIVGIAWSLATFFVVPLLVLEGIGVKDAFKRSWELIKRTWGEAVVGAGGIGLASFLLSLPVFFVCGLCFYLGLPVVGIVTGVSAIILLSILTSAMQAVYVTALYRYARDGEAPRGFDENDIAGAFKAKSR